MRLVGLMVFRRENRDGFVHMKRGFIEYDPIRERIACFVDQLKKQKV